MPAAPGEETFTFQPRGSGGQMTNHIYQCRGPDGVFTLVYGDFPADYAGRGADALLDDEVKRQQEFLGGRPLGAKPIRLDGHPGREFQVDGFTADEKPSHHFCRLYLVGNRLYNVIVIVPEENANAPEVNRFLDSFALAP
jgi:hypothetical protein